MRGKQVSTPRQWRSSRLGGTLATLALAAILPVLAIAWCAANHGGAPSVAADPIGQRAYPPATQQVALPHHRVYSVVKQGQLVTHYWLPIAPLSITASIPWSSRANTSC